MASIYLPLWESASLFLPLRAGKFFLAAPLFDQVGFRGNAFSTRACFLMKYQAILSIRQAFRLGRKRVRTGGRGAVFIREGMLSNKKQLLSNKKETQFIREEIWINKKAVLFIRERVLLNKKEIFSIREEALFTR